VCRDQEERCAKLLANILSNTAGSDSVVGPKTASPDVVDQDIHLAYLVRQPLHLGGVGEVGRDEAGCCRQTLRSRRPSLRPLIFNAVLIMTLPLLVPHFGLSSAESLAHRPDK
jgi:hypothetical protein